MSIDWVANLQCNSRGSFARTSGDLCPVTQSGWGACVSGAEVYATTDRLTFRQEQGMSNLTIQRLQKVHEGKRVG